MLDCFTFSDNLTIEQFSNIIILMSQHTVHMANSRNPLAVFAQNPAGVTFEDQEEGEKVILLLRAHIVTLLPSLLQIIILFILPLFISPVFSLLRVNIGQSLLAGQVFWLSATWYLFVFGFTFYKFIFWYFNVYLLTNERIIDFDFRGILHKETAYANLNQIQDVSPKIIGFFGTFFHFGNVFIQTAAAKPEFEFHAVARPDDVARVILEQERHEEGEKGGEIA